MTASFPSSAFKFNEFGVCTNPETIEPMKVKNGTFRIDVAQTPEGDWVSGYSCRTPHSGSTCGASLNRERFPTRQASIDRAAYFIVDRFVIKGELRKMFLERCGTQPKEEELGGLFA